jgi:hypothetical protein
MPTCFVIQPFDRGKFDGRYKDTFKPAIEAAGFEPYRVDENPSVSIPIDQIDKGIKEAAVCFADITDNNPNVLFELGYAIACHKELAIVRERKARQKFPFDLRHRAIILYDTVTRSDYHTLQEKITERLKAIYKTGDKIAKKSPLTETNEDLSVYERIVLAAIVDCTFSGFKDSASEHFIRREAFKHGLTDLAVARALTNLTKKLFIEERTIIDPESDRAQACLAYSLTKSAWLWVENTDDELFFKATFLRT